jgi:hypothetical protein
VEEWWRYLEEERVEGRGVGEWRRERAEEMVEVEVKFEEGKGKVELPMRVLRSGKRV